MKKHFFKYHVFIVALAFFLFPLHAGASVASYCTANLGVPTISLSGGAVLDWTAGLGADTRGSFAGVTTTYHGDIEVYNADYADGVPWQNTYMSVSHGVLPDIVSGSADTHSSLIPAIPVTTILDPNRMYASSNLFLSSPGSSGSVLAQSVLSGQFTVNQATTLTVTLPFSLSVLLSNTGGAFSAGDAIAALFLYDFAADADPLTGQQPVLTSQEAIIRQILNSNGISDSGLVSGILTLSYDLVPNFIYDFEASATVNSSAAVPLPGTLILFGPAVMALAMFRKKFIHPDRHTVSVK